MGVALLFLVLTASVATVPVPLQAQAPRLERAIKVGIIDTYSGPPAVFGNDALNGFKLALAEINRDGVLGARIEFVTRDERFSPEVGLSMARELVLQEKVDILVGTINSATALAIGAYAKEQKIPFLVWISKSEKITGQSGHRYVFSTGENTAMAGRAIAEALARKPYTKFWIGAEDYEYGHSITNSFWKFMKRVKPEVTLAGQTWWRTGEPDLVPYVTAIANARPDAVFFGTGGAGMTNVLRVVKATGMSSRIPIDPYGHRPRRAEAVGRERPRGRPGDHRLPLVSSGHPGQSELREGLSGGLRRTARVPGLPRVQHRVLHRRGHQEGQVARPGEVCRCLRRPEDQHARGPGGDARLRPPGRAAALPGGDEEDPTVRISRRHRDLDPAGGRGHADLRRHQEGPRPVAS
jgi:ABC-type sugar transport system substrate-binding protein